MSLMSKNHGDNSRFCLESMEDALDLYTDGSIIYIYLENFVTYDQCELYPGPYMNMVMGPNGSGKSSLVAAMAIGLGWHPNVLGRSKEVNEFIKYGRDRAVIEIGLCLSRPINEYLSRPSQAVNSKEKNGNSHYGDEDDDVEGDADNFNCPFPSTNGYILIKRVLNRHYKKSKSHSEWFLNGCKAGFRQIQQLTKCLNIQIDNLCQFLPQDKVAEFARMTPAELLIETEKAAADPKVFKMHQDLITKRSSERQFFSDVDCDRRQLESLVRQNDTLERIIQRYQEKETHLKKVKLCERKRPWLEYNMARDEYLKAKDNREEAKRQLEERINTSNPLKQELANHYDQAKQSEKKRGKMISALDKAKASVDKVKEDFVLDIDDKVDGTKKAILCMRKTRSKKQQELATFRQAICALEEELSNLPSPQNPEEIFQGELQKAYEKIEAVEEALGDLEHRKRAIMRDGESLNREIDVWTGKLQELEDEKKQRLRMVRTISPDSFEAYMWLETNQSLFKDRIYGPIVMEIGVRQPEAARHVESCINGSILMSFVSTNQEDSDLFLRKMEDEKKLRINVISLEATTKIYERKSVFKPFLSPEEIRVFGFQGYAIDYVEGPEPVLYALCDTNKLHLIPISIQDCKIDHEKIMHSPNIQKYTSKDHLYEIKRSRYDPSDHAVRCSLLKNAKFLKSSADESIKQGYHGEIKNRRRQLHENQEAMRIILQHEHEKKRLLNTLSEERASILERKRVLTAEQTTYRKKNDLIKFKRNELVQLTRELQEAYNEVPLKEELKLLIDKKCKQSIELARETQQYWQVILKQAKSHLEWLLLRKRIDQLEALVRTQESQFEVYRLAFNEADRQFTSAKERAKVLLDRAQEDQPDEETIVAFEDIPETLDELNQLIAQENARVELLMLDSQSIDHSVIREYEDRRKKISQHEQQISHKQTTLERLQGEIVLLKEAWIPQIRELKTVLNINFSEFFSRMHCAGEVELVEREDNFDEWEMAIKVKFRDTEELQRLSAQRQSGGEKSVTTILYLLAMQELAKAPFRVVDEINQGMDASNERRVHSLIVDTATRASKAQYFLITPKLLTNLEYHEKMHVLCVFNGVGIPEEDMKVPDGST